MAEEFQTGICGGNWWNLSKNMFMGFSSPCSASHDLGSAYGSTWLATDVVDHHLKPAARSCRDSTSCNINGISLSDHNNSVVFQDSQKSHHQQTDSDHSGGSSSSILMENSTLQMMGFGITSSSSSSSSSSDWSCQTLLHGNGRGESYIQEDMNNNTSGLDKVHTSQIQKDWSPKSFTSTGEDSSVNGYKAINQDFTLEHQQQQRLNHPPTCQSLSTSFSMGSSPASYGYPSTIVQGLFEPDPQPQLQLQQQQQSLFNERTMNYPSPPNYGTILNELSPSWHKLSPFLKPSLPKQQQPAAGGGGLHFCNNTPFWNASAAQLNDIRATFMQSNNSQPQFLMPTFEEKSNYPNLTKKHSNEQVRDSGGSAVKKGSEPAIKRPRIETPSPLPTFKVRKEKLGDRITALQQLVSPFGKTDTASVLHEAIEYIKFLHDQVSVLSTPYMKNGNSTQHQQAEKLQEPTEGLKQDLKSRGLCLVPISSTFPVANETSADFWTPTFGGTFR